MTILQPILDQGAVVGYNMYQNGTWQSVPASEVDKPTPSTPSTATLSNIAVADQSNRTVTLKDVPYAVVQIEVETPWYEKIANVGRGIYNWVAGGTPSCGKDSDPSVFADPDAEVPFIGIDAGDATGDGSISYHPVLPDDIFIPIEGQGSHFQSTPSIVAAATGPNGEPLYADNIVNANLAVKFGFNSKEICINPYLERDPVLCETTFEEATMDASDLGCYDGLMDLSWTDDQQEIDWGFTCPEPGYEIFYSCPSYDENRLDVYLGGYTLESYKYSGGEMILDASMTETLTSVEDLFLDPSSGLKIGSRCGDNPQPIYISIPRSWYQDGSLYLKIYFDLIVNAMEGVVTEDATYTNYLQVGVVPQ